MSNYEGMGVFYMGREVDPPGKAAPDPLLYDSRDLTTHAVCVGMTGSGKTGLCLTLLEEAALDGIPALVIDPKGDLGNLLLTFPDLRPADFRPWIDPGEAERKGLRSDEYAAHVAETWRKGLADWDQDGARIGKLRDAADMAIYTPGSSAGFPLAILRSLAAPSAELAADAGALRDRVLSAVSGLLGLLGIDADPIRSREHILVSTILDRAWRENRNLDLPSLIREIQKPPFDQIGVFDLETFFPAPDRLGLAMSLNNLLASPGFAAWTEGEPLDIQRLLYTPEGKPRIAVLSIAHLSDAERMFFVTILLNEVVSWMRRQPGTSSLRAILYMDEIYGYFPPSAMPPSKMPMLTLLKQARAYGLGCVLATQNPVDLDYKGLGNTGTWFIGRLQTDRDKARVIEGLLGAAPGDGAVLDAAELEKLLSSLGNRVFLMRNVHDDRPVLFETRWAMSYLRGPMTLPQIKDANGLRGAAASAPAAPVAEVSTAAPPPPPPVSAAAPVASPASAPAGAKPTLPPGVTEIFLRPKDTAAEPTWRARVLGQAKLHFVDAKCDLDVWQSVALVAPVSDDGTEALWSEAVSLGDAAGRLDRNPPGTGVFQALAAGLDRPRNYAAWEKMLASHLYQNVTLDLGVCPPLKLVSRPGESEGDFRVRVEVAQRGVRDQVKARLEAKYRPKLQTLQDRRRRAQERVEREQSQVSQQKMSTAISIGAGVLGALFGRKIASAGNVGRMATAMRSANRVGREQEDVARAGESVQAVQQQLDDLNAQFQAEVAQAEGASGGLPACERAQVRPRKSDVTIGAVSLVWTPWRASPDGAAESLF